jgi:hypothetical protein
MTSTVRSVRVEMDLGVAKYVANARLVGRETNLMADRIERRIGGTNDQFQALDGNLKAVNSRLLSTQKRLTAVSDADAKVTSSVTAMNRGLSETDRKLLAVERSSSRASSQLDTFSGRTGILLKLAAGLGPALLPIGAIGVPALAGMAAQGGFLAGALGASILALRGVGDGVKALEKARLDPTVENMQAAQQVLRRLGPDAAELVLHLDDLTKVRDKLTSSAASGFIPGLNEALDSLEDGVPMARRLVHEFGDISGDILAEGAESLTSDRWAGFFDYLQTNARPILNDTADSLGNVAHAFASIFTATAGDQQAFTGWLRDTTEDFDQWATRLDTNQDFQEFLAYARENGPEVADALGSIVLALAAVAEAAAPLGGPTLEILSAVADVIGAIASSPLGTPIFTAISAYSLLSTVLPGVKKGYEGIATAQSKVEGKFAAGRATLTTVGTDLLNVARYGDLATDSSKRLRTQLGPLIKGGLGLAGLAVATSGVADGMGLSNTASLALMGTLVGGWGAAVLGGVGLVQDFRHANDQLTASFDSIDVSLGNGVSGFTQARTEIASTREDIEGLAESWSIAGDGAGQQFTKSLQAAFSPQFWSEVFGDQLAGEIDELNAKSKTLTDTEDALYRVGTALGQDYATNKDGSIAFLISDMETTAKRAQPALEALGLTWEEISHMDLSGQQQAADDINAWLAAADSGPGRVAALNAAIGALDDGMMSTAESASALRENLDSLLGPQLNLSAATDQWSAGLRNLKKDLKDAGAGSDLFAKNAGGEAARGVIRDRVTDFEDLLEAQAGAGANAEKLTRTLQGQRKALIDAGAAAGFSKGEMRGFLNTLGLTPDLVDVLVKANVDEAETKLGRVKAHVAEVDAAKAMAHISVDPGNSFGVLGSIRSQLAGIRDKVVHVQIRQGTSVVEPHLSVPKARGGYIDGPGTKTSDSVPARLSRGEYVVQASAVDRYGVGFMDAVNARRFASGGPVSTYTRRRTSGDTATDGSDAANASADDAEEKKAKKVRHATIFAAEDLAHVFTHLSDKGSHFEQILNRLDKAVDKVKDSYEKEKSKLEEMISKRDDLLSQRSSLSGSVASAYQKDPFGNGLAGFDAQVEADTNDLDAMAAALATLVGNGLDPKSALYQRLAASADVNAAQQFAQLSAGDLAVRAQRLDALSTRAGALGDTVAGPMFDEAIANASKEIREQTKETRELRKEMRGLKDAVRDMKEHMPKEIGDAVFAGAHAGSEQGTEKGTKKGNGNRDGGVASMVRNQPRPQVKRGGRGR